MTDTTGMTFISYARKDGLEYAEYLERALPNTWRDKRNIIPFKDFTAEIERAIDNCEQVIAVITADCLREDSFVRRELARAVRKNKPVIVVRFEEIDPPIVVETHTWLNWFKEGWDATLTKIQHWIKEFVPSYTPPPLAKTLQADPHRDYLDALYDQIINYLKQVIIREVSLSTQHTPNMVAGERRSLLSSNMFRRAGLQAPEERIDTLQDGINHFEGRLLLLGEPGAGKTVSLLSAARDAVVRRLNDPRAPLPIWLRCAEWQSDPQKPLVNWIKEQNGLTLDKLDDTFIFFDGFDELGTNHVRKIEREIEEKIETKDGTVITEKKPVELSEDYDPRPLFVDIIPKNGRVLLSCRIKEYEDFGEKLNLKGAVTLRPLTDAQIEHYLTDLPDLWHAISSDLDLLKVVRTPLLLSLFAFGYRNVPNDIRALRDLNSSELSEAIFKQYVHSRYEREVRRLEEMGQTSPFTLDEIYDVLGYVAMVNANSRYKESYNLLSRHSFEIKLKDAKQLGEFIEYATLLHLIIPIDNVVRFIHLRLRDHFVRAYCYSRVENRDYYALSFWGYDPASALASLPDFEAVDVLVEQLKHYDSKVRRFCWEALNKIGWKPRSEYEKMISNFASENWNQLIKTDPSVIELLINCFNDADNTIRASIARLLGDSKSDKSVETLISALRDRSATVRENATKALGKIKNTKSIIPLITTLLDVNYAVRAEAATAITEVGNAETAAFLARTFELGDRSVKVKISFQYRISETDAMNNLIFALNDSYIDTCRRVTQILGKIGDHQVIDWLIAAFNNNNFYLRYSAVKSLCYIPDERSVIYLIKALKSRTEFPIIKKFAQQALENIGTPEALAALDEWRTRNKQ